MKLAFVAACLVATSLFAGQALADGSATATLEQPLAAKVKIVADGAVWVCEQASCIAGVTPDDWSSGVPECKDLAKQVGRVANFKTEYHPALQTAALEKCNTTAKGPGAVTASR